MPITFCFFSIRRRHTIFALVTGVQTCALPICPNMTIQMDFLGAERKVRAVELPAIAIAPTEYGSRNTAVNRRGKAFGPIENKGRSEERRVGKGGVSTCRSRWSPFH